MTGRKPTIAIVEDDVAVLQAIQRLINAYGYDSEIFTSAESYLQRNSQDAVDCLLLDINLTGISGVDLHRKLKEQGNRTLEAASAAH